MNKDDKADHGKWLFAISDSFNTLMNLWINGIISLEWYE